MICYICTSTVHTLPKVPKINRSTRVPQVHSLAKHIFPDYLSASSVSSCCLTNFLLWCGLQVIYIHLYENAVVMYYTCYTPVWTVLISDLQPKQGAKNLADCQ